MKRLLLSLFLCAAICGAHAAPPCVTATPQPAREVKVIPAGEIVVVIGEQTFNALLESLFSLPQPPSYPLGKGSGSACAGELVLARAYEGVKTGVSLRDVSTVTSYWM